MNEDYQVGAELNEDAEVELTGETSSAIDDDWYDDDLTEREPSEESGETSGDKTDEANQPEAEQSRDNEAEETANKEAEQNEEQKEEKEQEQNQLYTLEHFSGNREVTLDEMKAFAQKGLDYDRKVDSLQGKIAGYEEFISTIAEGSGLKPEQFMDVARAKMLIKAEEQKGNTLTEAQAILQIQAERRERAEKDETDRKQRQQEAEETAKKRRDDAIASFAKARPDVKPTDIPAEVWAEFTRTGDLMGAYAIHESAKQAKTIAELEKKIAAMENNAKAAQQSTGSSKSAGSSSVDQEFDAMWYDGT